MIRPGLVWRPDRCSRFQSFFMTNNHDPIRAVEVRREGKTRKEVTRYLADNLPTQPSVGARHAVQPVQHPKMEGEPAVKFEVLGGPYRARGDMDGLDWAQIL